MTIKKVLISLAATGLATAPIAAQAQQAQTAPISAIERTSTLSEGSENLEGGSNGILAALAVGIAAAFIALTVIGNDDDDFPTSP